MRKTNKAGTPPLPAANRELFLAPVVMDQEAVRMAHFERVFQRGADFWSGRHETKQDFEKAFECWRSVRHQHPEASWICALLDSHGGHVPARAEEAAGWFAGAEAANDAMSLLFLSGVSSGEEELRLTEKAAALGNARGLNRYGYLMGQQGNEAESFKYYELAANKGFIQGTYNMGVLYAHGKGVTECRHTGAELYLKAALKGYQNAQFNLGLYLLANGMLDVALFWFGKAAETGHAKACFNLGMHFKNTGDYCMAATYLTRAMRRNHEKAARKCVLMLPKAAKCPRALYLLGDAFKGQIDGTSVAGVKSRGYVEAAHNAVLVRDTCNKRCGAAVWQWLMTGKRLRVANDVARIIASLLWASRGEECWHLEVPPLLRLDDEEEEGIRDGPLISPAGESAD